MPWDAYRVTPPRRNREGTAILGGEGIETKDAIKFALTASNGAVLSVSDEMTGGRARYYLWPGLISAVQSIFSSAARFRVRRK